MTEQPQETVPVQFTLGIGDGKFTATAVVPAGQTNLTQILPVIQALDDSLKRRRRFATGGSGPAHLLQGRLRSLLPPNGSRQHLLTWHLATPRSKATSSRLVGPFAPRFDIP